MPAALDRKLALARAAIRRGGIIIARRQTEAITAMFYVIAEDHNGEAIVLVRDRDMGNFFRRQYEKLFPGKTTPQFRCSRPIRCSKPVYAPLLEYELHMDFTFLKAAILHVDDVVPVQVLKVKGRNEH